ncbi:MAG TPA: response regulator [Thermoanaerobaculia bacterium]|nr:response regulator [Thermoanaerobaculia bacterium]
MTTTALKQARVLLADDDQAIRQLVTTIVRRERVEIDAAADGIEAIERLREREYPVILLDLMMPRMDGFGVIDWLAKNPPLVKPVVLVVSAYADQRFKQVDPQIVAGVLRKPFEVGELGNIVRDCVRAYEKAGIYAAGQLDELRVAEPPN